MAPSGEHRPETLGYAQVHAAAVATSNGAIALRKQVAELHLNGAGKTVATRCETLTAQAVAAEKLAADLAVSAAALKIREDAAKAWNLNAPKDSEIKTAEEAVTAAKQKLKDASAASGDTSSASKELEAAQKHLGDLRRRRREADKAYDAAEKRADAKLKEITRDEHGVDGRAGTPDGTGTGNTGTTSPGAGTPATGTGTPSTGTPAKTTGGTPKPSTTAPASTKPSTTETSGGDDLSGLLTALASQQQQPQSAQTATPTAQATPAASTPQQTQQPEKDKDKDTPQSKTNPWDKILGSDGVLDTAELTGLIGTPLTAPLSTSSHSTPAAAVTPSAPAPAAPTTTGLSASATANAQPVTSGTSATGLNTATDVSGRAGEPRGPFSVGPETKTSGATGTGTSATSPAHATGTRPMGGGMPMVPMGGMGGPGGGGSKDRDQAQTTSAAGSAESDLLHGRHTVSEAVPGGTIAQKDHPRRRGEDAA
ncbi:hypothetical protein [Mycobacteroides abscessus]|uniref:hypothetical protein n=1 Tax=Mycobacteroides abscessus TaxID=36809 RepID=UPI00092BDF3B|nr:hypothetical protein [Mycobacteroides abscessus]SIN36698.1 Uncharacterised protein [Mycobacteroides abscessus subsp. abscessus]